ncbi:MAG: HisA/HisF-related TIM barrel protein [Pseudomonadota bacterium]
MRGVGPVTVGRVALRAPILPASGTFCPAHAAVMDVARLGAVVPKTVTHEPRGGNPTPRLVEAAGGLMNAIGIPSPGVEAFVAESLPAYAALGPPVIVSVSAGTAEGFLALTRRLCAPDCAAVAGLELNLSCPNLEGGGHLFAADPRATAAVVAACRSVTDRPLWAKLSPAVADIQPVATEAVAAGADALVVGNTMPALALQEGGKPRLGNRFGGLSGPPIKPLQLRLCAMVAEATDAPVVGCGGITTISDVRDYFAAGASAVAVGSATLARPSTMVTLLDALEASAHPSE